MISMNIPTVHVFFDMDGVLVTYERDGYIGKKAQFEQIGRHWFAKGRPDMNAIHLARALTREPGFAVGVASRITALPNTDLRREQYDDKHAWIARNLNSYGNYKIAPVVISHRNKDVACEMMLGRDLTQHDVLIDVFNENLVRWESKGGCAVKWLNGLNDASSWYGEVLDARSMTLDAAVTTILRAAYAGQPIMKEA